MFRPLLAVNVEDLESVKYPVWASYKLDGVRAIVRDGVVYGRSNKPIPSKQVQEMFSDYEGYDGELIVGDPTDEHCYRKTVSGVMTRDAIVDLSFHVFDNVLSPNDAYVDRYNDIRGDIDVIKLGQFEMQDAGQLTEFEEHTVDSGYEGVIIRDPNAHYKMGRSTLREGILLKIKRFSDTEAVVIGFEELMHNNNEAKSNELGLASRSSHKENKTEGGMLGALIVKHPNFPTPFKIGTGFTQDERMRIWENPSKYKGRFAKFKYLPVGIKDSPRHPVFLGWR